MVANRRANSAEQRAGGSPDAKHGPELMVGLARTFGAVVLHTDARTVCKTVGEANIPVMLVPLA